MTVAFSPGRIGDGPNGHATTSENQVSGKFQSHTNPRSNLKVCTDTRNLPDRSSPSLELSADTNEPSIVIDEDILRETLHAVENDLMSPVEGHEAFFNDLMTKAQALAVQGGWPSWVYASTFCDTVHGRSRILHCRSHYVHSCPCLTPGKIGHASRIGKVN